MESFQAIPEPVSDQSWTRPWQVSRATGETQPKEEIMRATIETQPSRAGLAIPVEAQLKGRSYKGSRHATQSLTSQRRG